MAHLSYIDHTPNDLGKYGEIAMVDTTDIHLGLKVVTVRARSAAKAMSIVAAEITRSRVPDAGTDTITLRLEKDQLEAFEFLVGNVLSLTREASEIADLLSRGGRTEITTSTANGSKRHASDG
jgi:putative heme degradation protein